MSWFWRALAAAWLVLGVACFVIGEDCVREGAMMMLCLIAADIDDVKKVMDECHPGWRDE